MGYSMGTRFLEDAAATGVMDKISYAASVIGLAAIGAMTATNVALTTPITFGGAGETDPTALQALFDTVMPKMLPLLLVLACYWLLGKKKVNVVVLLIALIVAGVVLALCGIIG